MTMGLTAERVERKYGISREDADEFALGSHRKAVAAQEAGRFVDEIVPVDRPLDARTRVRAPIPVSRRWRNLSRCSMRTGTVTAGNSSQTSDGAAAALVMSDT